MLVQDHAAVEHTGCAPAVSASLAERPALGDRAIRPQQPVRQRLLHFFTAIPKLREPSRCRRCWWSISLRNRSDKLGEMKT